MVMRFKALLRNSFALMDLLLTAVVLVATYIFFVNLKALSLAYSYTQNTRMVVIDEFVFTAIVLVVSLGILAIRRSVNLRRELEVRRAAEEELARSHRDLESIVQERIAELSEANERLREQVEEKRIAQEELKREKDFSDSVINSMPGVLYLFDEEGNFHRWNRGLEEVSGYSAGDISRMSPLDLFEGEDRDIIAERIERAFEEGEASAEAYFVSKNKERTPYYFTGKRVSIGGKTYCCGLGIDITEQKLAERKLRESEAKFSRAFMNSPLVVTVTSLPEGRFLDVNEAFSRVTGFSREEAIGRTALEMDIWADPGHREEFIREVSKSGSLPDFETSYRMKNGEVRDFILSAERVEFGGEKCLICTIVDITQRKKAEAALRESEERYRAIFEGASEGILLADVETRRFKHANPQIVKMLGYSPEELSGMGVEDIHPKEATDLVFELFNRGVRGEIDKAQDLPCLKKDGGVIYADINCAKIRLGGRDYLAGFFTDVTERKKAQEALEISERNYREIFDASIDALMIQDAETGAILDVNRAMCKETGYTREQILNMTVEELSREGPSYTNEVVRNNVQRAMREGHQTFEWEVRTKSGELIWVEVNLKHAIIGGKSRILAVSRDITERKKAEEALRLEREQLLSIFDSINQIVYVSDPKTYEILYVNQALKEHFQKNPTGGLCYKEFQNLDHPCDFCTNDIILNNKKEPYVWEYHNPLLDGDYLVTDRIIRWPDGRDVRFEIAFDITARKKAEEAFRKEALRRRILMEQSREGIAIIDQDHRVVEANPRFAEMLGYTGEEVLGLHTWDWEAVMTEAEIRADFADLTKTNAVFETRHRRKDGTTFDVEVSASGAMVGDAPMVLVVCRDITEKIKAQEAVRESRALLNSAMESLPFDFFAFDNEGRYILQNSLNRRRWGDLIGRCLEDMEIENRHKPVWREANMRALSGETVEGEFSYRHNGRKWHFYSIVAPIKDEDRTIGGLGVTIDITARKEAEEALRESEESFRMLVNSLPAVVFKGYADWSVDFFDNKVQELTGYSKEDFDSRALRWSDLVLEEDQGGMKEVILEALHSDGFYQREYRIRDKKGNIRWLMGRGQLVKDDNGRLDHVTGVLFDITDRKMADVALRDSEKRYRALVEDMPALVCRFKRDGTLTFVNSAYCEYFNALPEELIGENFFRFIPGEERENVRRHYRSLTRERPTVSYEHQVVAPNDEKRWQWWTDHALFDAEGNLVEYQSIGRDITEQKRAEEEVRRSRENLQTILDSMPFGVFMVDEDKRVIHANRAALDTLGYESEKDLLGRNCHSAMCPAYEGQCPVYDLGEEIDRSERVLSTPDGREIPVLKSVISIDIEGRKVLLETFVDITERKRALEALEKSEEKYRQVVDHANDAIFIIQDGVIKFPNPKTREMSGYTEEELANMPFSDLVHPEFRDMVAESHQKRLQGYDVPGTYSIRVVNKAKEELWVEISAMLINWDGRPATLNFLRDITPQKRLEDQLRQAQKMEAIGTLAGGIAHDFNNILGAIIGYAELMEMFDIPEDSPLKASLDEVLRAGKRAKELVKQILTFSRQTEQEHRPLKLDSIVKEALRFLRASLPATVEIHHRLESPDSLVMADPTQMHQVLMNLCTNAAQAMREKGGLLRVALEDVEVSDEDVSRFMEFEPGPYVRLTVNDTGCGISREVMGRIFDPYFTTKKPGEGTGMGLAVVHGIVKSHRGEILVESEMGRGTTFMVYLPRCRGVQEDFGEAELKMHCGGSERILFVDDEDSLVNWGKRVLGQLGYEVVGFTSGAEALEVFAAEPDGFDLVLTDLTMPQMTGIELVEELLKIRPDLPIILSTGYSEEITREKAEAIGVKEYIMKPIGTRKIAEVVRRALDKD